jgi:hypothetical protein
VRRPAAKNAVPYVQSLHRQLRRATWLLGLVVLVYVLKSGVGTAVVLLAGLWLFYVSQAGDWSRGRRALLTAAAFAVLCVPLLASVIPGLERVLWLGMDPETMFRYQLKSDPEHPSTATESFLLMLLIIGAGTFSLFVPVMAAALYARIRRARREQALLQAALAGRTGADEFLTLMRNMIDTRFEDVGFHLRYAEMLYARGDHRQAAVEARLITVQDPYHFNANLLLANAYYALRLYDDCRRVCDDYLAVTGYCFEFQELRQLAAGRATRP